MVHFSSAFVAETFGFGGLLLLPTTGRVLLLVTWKDCSKYLCSAVYLGSCVHVKDWYPRRGSEKD